MQLTQTETRIATPVAETWTEVRCPACRKLGHTSSEHVGTMMPYMLFRAYGAIVPTDIVVQVKCHRCQSIINWTVGRPKIEIVTLGKKREFKRPKVAFE